MLEVRGIHSYYGQAHILSDISLTLAKGEIVVLVGRNGAGKSTTIKSIMGMVRVGAGSIAYDGRRDPGRCRPTASLAAASATCRRSAASSPA
jgi:ABC-type branched-subunit amino acid transport system ATPase component